MAEMMVLDNIFQHEPLDLTKPTIRVFHILPGTGTIKCLMKQVEVDSEHTAISYVWGDPQPTSVILINEKLFQVRQNLHDFLVQMREDNVLESLWVDALCIDQTNISERNHQVQQMGSIYKDAHTVISWLGQGDDSVAQFLQLVVAVAKEVSEQRAARFGTSRSTDTTNLYYLSVHRRRFALANFIELVKSFCSMDYFQRLWIVQEVFLATGTHIARYEDMSINWIDLKRFLSTLFTMTENRLFNLPAFPFFHPSVYALDTAFPSSILAFIAKFSEKSCSDPRDHIFALRTLWDSCKIPIQVDYSLSGLALFVKLASLLLTSDVHPMSNAITLLNILHLGPEHFTNRRMLYAEKSIPIALSVAWSREIDMRELSEYRTKRLGVGEHESLEHTVVHDLRFCTCEHCIQLQLPETTIFREYVLRSRDHDPNFTQNVTMDEELYLVQIIGSETYFGIIEGDLTDSDTFMVITPACLNRASELPSIEEDDGRLAVSLSLRCFCELLGHLRPDEYRHNEDESRRRTRYWGIDCNRHDYNYDEDHLSSHDRDESARVPDLILNSWGRRNWRSHMRPRKMDDVATTPATWLRIICAPDFYRELSYHELNIPSGFIETEIASFAAEIVVDRNVWE